MFWVPPPPGIYIQHIPILYIFLPAANFILLFRTSNLLSKIYMKINNLSKFEGRFEVRFEVIKVRNVQLKGSSFFVFSSKFRISSFISDFSNPLKALSFEPFSQIVQALPSHLTECPSVE